MKIIFDNIVFSLQKAGGISVVWQELISRFLKTNHEVLFLEHETDKNNIFRQKLILPDKSIIKERNLFLKITRYLSPSVDFQDTFIFHSSYFRTCNNKNAINVTTVHDFTYEYFYKGKRRGAFLHLWQRNRAILRSDAIICISENTKKDLLKFLPQVDSRKIHVINNGVSSDYHIIGEDYRYKQYAGWLLFVGHRVAYKNGEFFARSIKNTNYKVVFCGPKMSDDEIMLYDSILGRDRYITVSQISNEELNIYYNSCLCLVYPSSYEGFGIPILEAQSAGCPVIAYNASSIPEVIGSNVTLLMNELTQEELLNKLSLVEDEQIREQVVKDGLKNASNYSWDIIQNKYLELYTLLVHSRG